MNLEDLFKETDALTYANSLKVILTQLKEELSTIEEMQEYQNQACERARKLVRKADNQYRVIAKLIQREHPTVSDLKVEEDLTHLEELRELMEEE